MVVNGVEYDIGQEVIPITIDFTNPDNAYAFKYKISHPDPNFTTNLKLLVHYNPNGDSRYWYNWGYIVNNDVVKANLPYSPPWNGDIVPQQARATYFTSDWKFMDQKADANDNAHPDEIIADSYFMYIFGDVEKAETVPGCENFQIKVNKGLGEMHVEAITIFPKRLNKRQYVPQVTITLCLNDGSPCVGAQMLWRWEGAILGDDYIHGILTSDVNGEIILDGPSYSSNSLGEIIFTVISISKTGFVYNPYKNNSTLGLWPTELPHAVLTVP